MSTVSMRFAVSNREPSVFQRIRAAAKSYRIRRQHYLTARALAGLSDHLLKDMGIARSEIHALVYSPSVERGRGGSEVPEDFAA
jgi:uncharacterized protein YjiS (DUF1127 family)